MKKLFTLIIAVIIAVSIFGQAPGSFKYQAILRDASGEPMDGTISIEITILQGSSSGTEVFSETHSNVPINPFGLINLEIGSVNTTGISAINWADGPYFVTISVNGTEMGSSQLLSVPYALYAGNTECCVWNKDGNNINYMAGNVSIGTESNWAKLNVGGFINFEPGTNPWGSQIQLNATPLDHGMTYQFTSTGGDAVEGQGKLLLTNTKYGHAMVIDSTLNISIGTESNWARLNVGGFINFEPGINPWGSQIQLNASSLNQGLNYSLTSTGGDAIEGPGKFLIRNAHYNAFLIIDSLGKVGLGTIYPETRLHVAGDWILGTSKALPGFGTTAWLTSNDGNLYEGGGLDWAHHFSAYRTGDIVRFGTSDSIGDEPDIKVVINNIGNIGIGTPNPQSPLHIGDFDEYSGYGGGMRDWMNKGLAVSWDSDNIYFGLKDEGVDQKVPVIAWGDNNPGDALRFIHTDQDNVTEKEIAIFESTGEIGIGVLDPKCKVHVNGTIGVGGETGTFSDTGNSIELLTDTIFGSNVQDHTGVRMFAYNMHAWGEAKLAIQTSTDFQQYETSAVIGNDKSYFTGNMGIGTTEPASKFQVTDGDVYVESIGTGVIIKSPDGNCWRISVDNSGNLNTKSITCP